MHFPMHDQDHVVIPWNDSAPERMTHSQARAAKREAKASVERSRVVSSVVERSRSGSSVPIKRRPVKRRAHPIS
jgi:hypothetical protein